MAVDRIFDFATHRKKTFRLRVYDPETLRRYLTSTSEDIYQKYSICDLPVKRRARLPFNRLTRYLSNHAFSEIVVQLTFGSLWNLQWITDGAHAGRIQHLTLVVDTSTFVVSHREEISRMLGHSFDRLTNIQTLVVKFDGYDESEQVDQAVWMIADAVPATMLRVEEVRVELTNPRQLQTLLDSMTRARYPGRTQPRWLVNWSALQRLHIGVPHYFLKSTGAAGTDAIDGLPTVFDGRSHNQALDKLVDVHPTAKTVSLYRLTEKNRTHRPTPFLSHESIKSDTTQKLLTSIRGLWTLWLRWEDADAQVIIDLIKNNYQTLQNVLFDVSLKQPGTWDQIFRALRRCKLLSMTAYSATQGYGYSTTSGLVRTGYLSPGHAITDIPVLRWSDRFQLAVLLRKVHANRAKVKFAVITDPCWTSLIENYRTYEWAKAKKEESSWLPDPALGFSIPRKRRKLVAAHREGSKAQDNGANAVKKPGNHKNVDMTDASQAQKKNGKGLGSDFYGKRCGRAKKKLEHQRPGRVRLWWQDSSLRLLFRPLGSK